MRRSRNNEPLGQVAHCIESELREQTVEEQAHDDVEHALGDSHYDRFNSVRESITKPIHGPHICYWAGGSSED